MPSLRELQQRFVGDLLTEDGAALLPWIGDDGVPAAERLAIYRGNCREGFLAALAAGYPVLQRLTGADYFRQLAREYQREFPSPSGNLFHAGAKLAAFLERRFAGTAYEYFSHVARVEWACQEVLAAPDHAALDYNRLAGVSPADHARLRFELDPATRLVRSVYPVVRIWEAHQDAREPEAMDIGAGGEQGLVQRRGGSVSIYRLSPADYACLAALAGGRPLSDALEDAAGIDGEFDLAVALRRWAQLGFIVDFSLADESA
jgi:hypothetical protein